ncbi:unnamed protein product [Schistosoma turkestanicum]|nr:unnamed protein product [Schistosoma turkestanicum]
MLLTEFQVNTLKIIHPLYQTNNHPNSNINNNHNYNLNNHQHHRDSTFPLNQYFHSYTIAYKIFICMKGIVFILIITSALFGNALIFLAFFRFKRLRHVRTNIFLLSLAVADFTVALLVMPFNAIMSLLNYQWLFGKLVCDLYNATDVLFSTSSILHLCCISMDRYIAIIHPLNYENKMSKQRILALLGITWTLSFLISYMPILIGLHKPLQQPQQPQPQQQPQKPHGIYFNHKNQSTHGVMQSDDSLNVCDFDVNPYYAIISSCVSFWVPSVIMIIVYIRIFIEARKQERKIAQLHTPQPQVNNTTIIQQISSDSNNNNQTNNNNSKSNSFNLSIPDPITLDQPINPLQLKENTSNFHFTTTDERLSSRVKLHSESKAARTLGIVMGAFLLCWLPFFLWYTIINVCSNHCQYPNELKEILYWIGYFNSSINPIIYAFYNRTFRQAFIKIIEFQKRTTSLDEIQQCWDSCRSPISRRYKFDPLNEIINKGVTKEHQKSLNDHITQLIDKKSEIHDGST